MTLSSDEAALLVVAPLFIATLGAWAVIVHSRARALFQALSERADPALWQALGAPAGPLEAMRDPARRWRRFIASREYRRRLDPELVELIDDYRRRNTRMLIIFGIAALLLLIRFWAVLGPRFP